MAPHSGTLAWKIPWTEEPGRLQSMGSWRVKHDWETSLSFTFDFHALEKQMATHSSVLAWRIPGMGSHRVGHDWSDLAVAVAVLSVRDMPGIERIYLLFLLQGRYSHFQMRELPKVSLAASDWTCVQIQISLSQKRCHAEMHSVVPCDLSRALATRLVPDWLTMVKCICCLNFTACIKSFLHMSKIFPR